MKYDPLKHHCRSVRLKNYDYDSLGAYFIPSEHEKTTIILGRLVERQVEFSPFGQVAERHL